MESSIDLINLKLFSSSMPSEIRDMIIKQDRNSLDSFYRTGLYNLYLKKVFNLIEANAAMRQRSDNLINNINKLTQRYSNTFNDSQKVAKLGTSTTKKGKELSKKLCQFEDDINHLASRSDALSQTVSVYIEKTSELFLKVKDAYDTQLSSKLDEYLVESGLNDQLSDLQKDQVNMALSCYNYDSLIDHLKYINIDYTILALDVSQTSLSIFAKNVFVAAVLTAHSQLDSRVSSNQKKTKEIIKKANKKGKYLDIGYDIDLYKASHKIIESTDTSAMDGIKNSEQLQEKLDFFIDESNEFITKCSEALMGIDQGTQ
ncbi:MAG: hypothetical protein CMF46_03015 [Legionellales bacterium]|nr:hypothetical protein [Legionellales bacterium]|tara:strand:- start:1097 stop:2044 length:948 start_codon:yes stop_codon:yes gene_type:complete